MTKILYIDPVFGISGDMMISALVDAGVPFEVLEGLLSRLPVEVPPLEAESACRGIVEGVHLRIGHSDLHLSISTMEEIIDGIEGEERARRDARAMLDIIVDAEARVHGVEKDKVHLHELSHIDTLIDLLCVSKGIEYLGVEKVYCGPVPCGRGMIKTAHGFIPNPSPATIEILAGHKVVFYDEPLELTTPTGATIVRYYAGDAGIPPEFTIERTGHGVGTYNTDKPDVLRVHVGLASTPGIFDEEVYVVEADIDDMNMEYCGAIAERIREGGALDVLYYPVYMKKGRIGVRISAIAGMDAVDEVRRLILEETTTFGLRIRKEMRDILKREEIVVTTSLGPVRVKKGYGRDGTLLKKHIEYEDIRTISDEKGIPYRMVLETARKEIE